MLIPVVLGLLNPSMMKHKTDNKSLISFSPSKLKTLKPFPNFISPLISSSFFEIVIKFGFFFLKNKNNTEAMNQGNKVPRYSLVNDYENFRTDPGWVFNPDDETMIFYLRNKLRDSKYSHQMIHDYDIYTIHPNDLIGYESAFFFTKRVPLKQSDKRKSKRSKRATVGGTWHSNQGEQEVKHKSGIQIGWKISLKFVADANYNHEWYMNEYRLLGGLDFEQQVICKVYCKKKKEKGVNAGNAHIPMGVDVDVDVDADAALVLDVVDEFLQGNGPAPNFNQVNPGTDALHYRHMNHFSLDSADASFHGNPPTPVYSKFNAGNAVDARVPTNIIAIDVLRHGNAPASGGNQFNAGNAVVPAGFLLNQFNMDADGALGAGNALPPGLNHFNSGNAQLHVGLDVTDNRQFNINAAGAPVLNHYNFGIWNDGLPGADGRFDTDDLTLGFPEDFPWWADSVIQ